MLDNQIGILGIHVPDEALEGFPIDELVQK
jgi:hypothetical protein